MFSQEEITRLLDIANFGTHKGLTLKARTIYQAILHFSPTHSGALLGLAFNHITVGEYDKAETIINDVLAKNASDFDAKCLLGLSYFLSDKKETAKPLLEEVVNNNSSSKALAQSLLNEI